MIRSKLPQISVLILLTLVAFMPKNTAAQKKPKKAEPAKASAVAQLPEISYTVSMPKPSTHYLEVEMRVRWAQMPDALELKMPVWTPGSYLVREYVRHVQDFTAANAAGAPVGWRKINKNTWQVDAKGSKEIVATYRVYANELTVRTNELNDEHAFWNNTATLLFVRDRLNVPATVRVIPFGNWRVATGLPSIAPNTFRAENFDVLYDSPFEVSDFREVSFEVQGKKHRIVVTGEGNYDLDKLAAS